MRFLVSCIAGIIAILVAPLVQELLLLYLIGDTTLSFLDPSGIFYFRLSFAFFFCICVLLIITSALYLKVFSTKQRILIPLIPMLIASTTAAVYRKNIIDSSFYFYGIDAGNIKMYEIPVLGAVSGFLMILTFLYLKSKVAKVKVSIDLDDTILVKEDFQFIEVQTSPLVRGPIKEYFRLGTKNLFEYLVSKQFEIGIYTNSYRGKPQLESWFNENDLPIHFIINQQIHDARIDQEKNRYSLPDKCPHLFGIDIHIDDLVEIKTECEKYQTKVILAEPNENWVENIIKEIEKLLND